MQQGKGTCPRRHRSGRAPTRPTRCCRSPDLQLLVTLDPARFHEIIVATTDPFLAAGMTAGVAASLGADDLGLEVVSWGELNPTILEFSSRSDELA